MNKYVVYTVLVGGYDVVLQPLVVDDRFDYVLFTDSDKSENVGIWQVRTIPYENKDLTRVSRYPKMHPNVLLSGYDASLYIDANVQITGQSIYDRFIECYNVGVDWAGIQHPYRDCIYDEAYVIYGLDTEINIFRWCHQLRSENYPRHRGLFENNVIFRRHNDHTNAVNRMWWNLYKQHTRRDQLTLFYVFWKIPAIKTTLLLPRGESSWNSNTVKIHKHNKISKYSGRRGVDKSFLEHARNRCRCGLEERMGTFKEFHFWLYGLKPTTARILLCLWGWYALLIYGAIIKYRAYKRHKNEK